MAIQQMLLGLGGGLQLSFVGITKFALADFQSFTPSSAGAQNGDLVVLVCTGFDPDTDGLMYLWSNTDIPTGYTSLEFDYADVLVSSTNYRYSFVCSYQIITNASASVAIPYTVPGYNPDSSGSGDVYALFFRPTRIISSVTCPVTPNFQYTTGNPGSQTVSPQSETTATIVIGFCHENDSTTPGAFTVETPSFDATYHNTNRTRLGYKLYNSNSQEHTIDKNDTGSATALGSFYLRIT